MKKIVFVFAAMLAIAASCTKEDTQINNEYDGIAPVFTASVGATKAELIGTKVNWVANDHISVWNGTVAADYSTTGSGATADFTTTDDTFTSAANYVALYPYDGSASFTSGSIVTVLPAAQTATAAGFDPAANIAYASSTNTTLSFKNAVAYLQFTVPTGMSDLTSVSFKGNSGEKVAGECTIDTSSSELVATGSETATISGTFTEGTTYYLAVAPQAYATGYTVTITRTATTYEMVSKATSITFERSKARNIGELWDGSYEVTGTAIVATTAATMTVGPRTNSKASLKEYTYSYSGSLSAGTVNIKKAYSSTVSGTATVPVAGWYHLFYNETTGTFKIYDQELSVNFGSDGVNCINASAEGSSVTLHDYNRDAASSVVVTLGAGFTGLYSNDFYTANPSWEFWLDDYDFKPGMLYSNVEINKTKGTGNTSPATITVSGLDPSAKYDFRISAGRGKGSLAARQTQITIGGTTKTYNQGLDNTGSTPATEVDFRTNNVAVYEGLSPNGSGEVEISVVGIDTGTACQAHVGCIFISRVVE